MNYPPAIESWEKKNDRNQATHATTGEDDTNTDGGSGRAHGEVAASGHSSGRRASVVWSPLVLDKLD